MEKLVFFPQLFSWDLGGGNSIQVTHFQTPVEQGFKTELQLGEGLVHISLQG